MLTNTVLHATKMPVRAWVGAITDLCRDPAGVSARDISDRWDVTEKSAWAMLTRIQDALAEPEVAGAGLASNAPLWFELAAVQRQHVEHERARRDHAEVQAVEAQTRAEKEAAEQVERDVRRALADVDSGRGKPASADLRPVQTESPMAPSSPASGGGGEGSREIPPLISSAAPTVSEDASGADPRVSEPLSGGVSPSRTPSERPVSTEQDGADRRVSGADVGGDRPVAKPATDVVPSGHTSADEVGSGANFGIDRRTSGGDVGEDRRVAEQVKSDVERALAEAFGEPLPGADAPKIAPSTPAAKTSKPESRPADEGASAAAKADLQTVDAGMGRGPDPELKAGDDGMRLGAISGSETGDGGVHRDTQERRRVRREPQRETKRVTRSEDDSLGGEWLGGQQQSRDQDVSEDRDQPLEIDTPELGPAWASSPVDLSGKINPKRETSPDQVGRFPDEDNAGERDEAVGPETSADGR